MHELAITQNILNIALSQAEVVKAKKVDKINLVIGELSGIVSDCDQFYFDFLKKGSIAEGASLIFEIVPAQLKISKFPTKLVRECLLTPDCHCEEHSDEAISRDCHAFGSQ